jgi:hypothetical protein
VLVLDHNEKIVNILQEGVEIVLPKSLRAEDVFVISPAPKPE